MKLGRHDFSRATQAMPIAAAALQSQAQRELLRVLSMAYADERRALDAIDNAVASSEIGALPETGHELFAFVARELVAVLTADLGPRLTIAVLAELEPLRDFGRFATSKPPPGRATSKPSSDAPATGPRRRLQPEAASSPDAGGSRAVLLVDSDRLARTRFARALIQRRCDVTVVESLQELKTALVTNADLGLAIVDMGHKAATDVLDLLGVLRPSLPVIARSSDQESARAALHSRGIAIFATCERTAPPENVAAIAASSVSLAPTKLK